MMKTSLRCLVVIAVLSLTDPKPAKADFWGGDVPLLAQLISNTLEQIVQLKQILGNGQDTLGFIRDLNAGIREAMQVIRTMNQTIRPGVLFQYDSPEDVLQALQEIYGMIPKTSEAKMQTLNDQAVAEAVTLHNQAFQYAELIDPEAEKIKDFARDASPMAAGKLTAQSIGVLIHVSNQVLRTNAAMLKLMSQSLALQNRREKIGSAQFQMQYDGLSSAMGQAPTFRDSVSLGR